MGSINDNLNNVYEISFTSCDEKNFHIKLFCSSYEKKVIVDCLIQTPHLVKQNSFECNKIK
jgi:hypothetical protein